MNIYSLSKYVGKKKKYIYISRRNRNICSLVKFDNVVLEKKQKVHVGREISAVSKYFLN